MAYIEKNISVLAYGNGFTLWNYVLPNDTDTTDDVMEPDYFKDAAAVAQMRNDDLVIVTGPRHGAEIFEIELSGGTVVIKHLRNREIEALEKRIAALESINATY